MSEKNLIYQVERRHDPQKALQLLYENIQELQLEFRHSQPDLDQSVSSCQIYLSNKVISEGAGKGSNHRLGSIAEAIEHGCISDAIKTNDKESLTSIKKINLPHDRLLVQIQQYSSEKVHTVSFLSLTNNQKFNYPRSLLNPYAKPTNFTESKLKLYSTNSGTAFGCDLLEAQLHGLNEVIERHYQSLLLIEILNNNLSQEWHVEFEDKKIIDSGVLITLVRKTIFNNYVAICVFIPKKEGQFVIHPISGGCSYFAELAVQRAKDEMVQSLVLSGEEEYKEDLQAAELLLDFPKLEKIFRFQIEMFSSLPIFKGFLLATIVPVEEQLARIVGALVDHGYEVGSRVLYRFKNNTVVNQIVVPGLERFNLIRYGKMVAYFQK